METFCLEVCSVPESPLEAGRRRQRREEGRWIFVQCNFCLGSNQRKESLPCPLESYENMVELRLFSLLIYIFLVFFIFQYLSLLPFPGISPVPPSPHSYTGIEGSLSAPLGKEPACVEAAAGILPGPLLPRCCGDHTSSFHGCCVRPFALLVYSEQGCQQQT